VPSLQAPDPAAPLDDSNNRGTLLSGSRIRIAFTAFTVIVIGVLAALVFAMVAHIFSRLTPTIRADLEWKAKHGASELAHLTDVGIVLGDAKQLNDTFTAYAKDDADILALVAADTSGTVLSVYGARPGLPAQLFLGRPNELSRQVGSYGVWTDVMIEGAPVGKVAIAVSTARLDAGRRLETNILVGGSVGALLAVLSAFAFVSFYISPILRLTQDAFKRLEKTTESALEAARLKSEFLANMSHEIRTPMNGVLGMIELLHGTPLNEKQLRYAHTLHASANGLMTVLNDILDFSKIEAGKLDLHPSACKIRDVLEEVSELFAARAHLKRIEVTCHVDRNLPHFILLDRERLKQIVSNLMGNALKFTERGEVKLRAVPERVGGQARVRFEVSDTGIGIPAEAVSRLFGAFSQVDGSLTRKYGGTGLGLAICKQLVALMGGEIGVESTEGQGSTFSFWIPLVEASVEDPQEELLAVKVRTLIVDDNATNRFVLEELLTSWGVEHSSACDALSAVAMVEEAQREQRAFGLMITDMHMPDIDGLGLARRVLQAEAVPKPAILLLTSQSESGLPEGTELFVDGFMQKPVRASDLLTSIGKIFKTGRPRQSSKRRLMTPSDRPPAEERRLLVVEDNPINQEVMSEMLRELGYVADLAENGRRALEMLEQRAYPVVLMDCQMPVLDGYQTTVEIRQRELPGQRTPIIAVTAHALAQERQKVLAVGMDDYISKPVSQQSLGEVLGRWWPGPSKSLEPLPLSGPTPGNSPPISALDPSVKRSDKVIRLFLANAPGDIQEIEAAIATGDGSLVKSTAHKLKGGCLAIGIPRMATVCVQLESGPANRAELLGELSREFERVKERLEKTLARTG